MPEPCPPPVRVLHVITGLARAGAEIVLYRLLERADQDRIAPVAVVSLTGDGPLGDPIRALGVPVVLLDIRKRSALPGTLRALCRTIRDARPDVVQTWMYHGDLVGGLAARSAGVRNVVWGLHASTRPATGPRPAARVGVGISAWLSHRVPARIIACAEAARDVHVGLGYDEGRMQVIPNGFELLATTDDGRRDARSELRIASDRLVLLRLARYHPQKDYPTLLRAAGIVARQHDRLQLVLAGLDVTPDNDDLRRLLEANGLRERTTLLGLRDDPERLLAAADVVVSSSSYGEAHPLVLGEAMVAGVPVVATDVGDSAALVGPDAGVVVPPCSADSLAQALDELLSRSAVDRATMGRAGRLRIEKQFSLDRMVEAYQSLYVDLARRPQR